MHTSLRIKIMNMQFPSCSILFSEIRVDQLQNLSGKKIELATYNDLVYFHGVMTYLPQVLTSFSWAKQIHILVSENFGEKVTNKREKERKNKNLN